MRTKLFLGRASLFLFCISLCAQTPSVASSQSTTPDATASTANPFVLDAIPAKINFDVISFKPCPPDKEGNGKVDMPTGTDYIAYHCETASRLVYFAYNGLVKTEDFEGVDAPWMYRERYEFIAKVAPEDIPAWQKLNLTGRRILMRGIIAKAFKLKVSVVNFPEPVYLLTVAKGGAKLKPYKDGDQTKIPDGRTQTGKAANWIGLVAYFQDTTMSQFAELLGGHLDRHVVDRTGLTGAYTFSLPLAFGVIDPNGHLPTPDDLSTVEGLSLLGLRLETAKVPTDRLSIDHIEQPESN